MKFFLLFLPLFLFSYERHTVAMGTFLELQAQKKEAVQQALHAIQTIEQHLSTFIDNSEVSLLNKDKKLCYASYFFDDVMQASLFVYTNSDGYFNPFIGSISKDGFRFGLKERVLLKKQLQSFQIGGSFKKNGGCYTLAKAVKVDFGGIAKGYGVDQAASVFREYGITKGLIALSGDIRCFGPCQIAIDDPFEEEKSVAMLVNKNKEMGVSTSGIYRRYVYEKRLNHIINPYTKTPQSEIVSLTLFGTTKNTLLDAFATAIVAMGKKRALMFLQDQRLFDYLLIDKNRFIYLRDRKRRVVWLSSNYFFVYNPLYDKKKEEKEYKRTNYF